MLLSLVSTIIMCSNEVSSWSKADVHLADTANCQSPPVVYVCVCVWVKWMCLHMCVYSKHTKGKKSQRKPEVIQSDSRPSLSARRHDRGSSDKWFLCLWSSGQHSSLSTSICDPVFLFLNILPFSRCTFYPLPNVPVPHPFFCGWVCMLCRVAVSQMSPQGLHKLQMGITGSGSVLSSITKIMWWCDTQGTA